MYRSRLLQLSVVLVIMACRSASVSAGTIRNDVGDSAYTALAADPAYASVGQFTWTSYPFEYYASGVLIAENWVLTAGHVVDDTNASLTFNLGGVAYQAENWVAHPKWSGNVNKGFDIGLVHLSETPSVQPADRYTGSDSPLTTTGISVGYGLTGTGETGYVETSGFEKRAGENVIDEWYLGPGKPGRIPHVFLSDFDSGLASDNYSGSAEPEDLEYLIAPGDSGGGVFNEDGLLIGIHSFTASVDGLTNSDYGDISGHIWVPFFNDWIDSVISGTGGGGDDGPGGGPPGGVPPGQAKKGNATLNLTGAPVPEPSTWLLLASGCICLFGARWRRRKR
jgi:S1-C subfamily serine protease